HKITQHADIHNHRQGGFLLIATIWSAHSEYVTPARREPPERRRPPFVGSYRIEGADHPQALIAPNDWWAMAVGKDQLEGRARVQTLADIFGNHRGHQDFPRCGPSCDPVGHEKRDA